jgi:hypothetical protein
METVFISYEHAMKLWKYIKLIEVENVLFSMPLNQVWILHTALGKAGYNWLK